MASSHSLAPELVQQAQAGDPQAQGQLLEALEPVLRSFFIKRIGMKTEVDDLVQNTFLRIHKGLADLKDPSRLKAFTLKAALFELQDLYRGRYGAKERLYDPDQPPGQMYTAPPSGDRFDVERALGSLSPKARQIIELREYGYRYQEIAEMVDTTEAAVKMQVKRAFEKMREALVAVLVALLLPFL